MSDYYEMLERTGYENGLRAGRAELAERVAAAEERGRRSGVEERDELRALLLKTRTYVELCGVIREQDPDTNPMLREIDAALAPRDSAPVWDNEEFLAQHYESRGHSAEEARRMARGEPEPKDHP